MRFLRTIPLAPFFLSRRLPSDHFTSRQLSPSFSSLGKMGRSGSSSGRGHPGKSRGSRPNSDSSPGSMSQVGTVKAKEACSSQTYADHRPVSSSGDKQCSPSAYDEEFSPLGFTGSSGSRTRNSDKRGFTADPWSKVKMQKIGSSQFKNSSNESSTSQLDGSSLPSRFGKKAVPTNNIYNVCSGSKNKPFSKRRTRVDLEPDEKFGKGGQLKPTHGNGNADSPIIKPFDICLPYCKRSSVSKSCEQFEDGGALSETDHHAEGDTNRILRPGMVLLKHYLTISEQVEIVKNCRELGLGPGGFYQPGYKDGAKLRLQMMCLGLDWDPQTRKYQKQRSIDGCEPPGIPHKFIELVERAIQDAHALIVKDSEVASVEYILPAMSPDICIVNFYTSTGRLGLHQDRDESEKSLQQRLPVVSFSIGDSAVFLYGDERDIDKAEEVILDSGDVVIFGGDSRLVFHGVPCIISKSAPEDLRRDAKLRHGRLNLTFRKF